MSKCNAVQFSDQMSCSCGNVWDMNDPYPPECKKEPTMTTNKPMAWVTADTVDGQAVNGKPRRIWWENNEGVGMPIYAAPQPTEQREPVASAPVAAQQRFKHPQKP